MSPEYGATCAIFPVDAQTIEFLRFTARDEQQIALVESYMKAQGLFHSVDSPDPDYSDTLSLDLSDVDISIAGPKRPQDRILLRNSSQAFNGTLATTLQSLGRGPLSRGVQVNLSQNGDSVSFELNDGAVVFAAITSCTNTSNPSVMIGAGLLARKAVEAGLRSRPWVKTSLAPGSKVVSAYLEAAGLQDYLDTLGFNLIGYGCTTCIGNSGPLPEAISNAIQEQNLVACSVLSGNRNFEGRISPDVRANYLASPPLVVAYAIAGRMDINFSEDPLGEDAEGNGVYLRDIWPSQTEIRDAVGRAVTTEMYAEKYADVFAGDERWNELPTPESDLFHWDPTSTYIRRPSFFEDMEQTPAPLGEIRGMRVLALLGDSVTTDHISPAGAIPVESPAGLYLTDHGVPPLEFNSFGSRRGNHEVMMRGTFGNVRLRNLLVPGVEGGYTVHPDIPEMTSIYEAATQYKNEGVPLLVIAGKEYGTGSSRDWAAKGTNLLGVRVVLAESYERIHRSNLIGMGVLPLQFESGESARSHGLTGHETFDLLGLTDALKPRQRLTIRAHHPDEDSRELSVLARIDTPNEVQYYRHGGILHFVLRSLLRQG
jgi:aconitate hydratase